MCVNQLTLHVTINVIIGVPIGIGFTVGWLCLLFRIESLCKLLPKNYDKFI